ncbi:MAG: type VI secretion system tube protein Hcp [Azoarcus sp.]|jgi:type VI secretion system secreted protein Hcp|nr:type VI secretion system tube protein Hcp [Azoarcus sp.]
MSSEQNIFIQIDGITGESQDNQHSQWIDVLGFSYGVSRGSDQASIGEGNATGRANFDTLSFTHYVDKTSPNLFQYCANGKHIPKVVLECCKSDGTEKGSFCYFQITLETAIVTHVSPAGSSSDQGRVHESVSLAAKKIQVEYKGQQAGGSLAAAVTTTWDIAKNQA